MSVISGCYRCRRLSTLAVPWATAAEPPTAGLLQASMILGWLACQACEPMPCRGQHLVVRRLQSLAAKLMHITDCCHQPLSSIAPDRCNLKLQILQSSHPIILVLTASGALCHYRLTALRPQSNFGPKSPPQPHHTWQAFDGGDPTRHHRPSNHAEGGPGPESVRRT